MIRPKFMVRQTSFINKYSKNCCSTEVHFAENWNLNDLTEQEILSYTLKTIGKNFTQLWRFDVNYEMAICGSIQISGSYFHEKIYLVPKKVIKTLLIIQSFNKENQNWLSLSKVMHIGRLRFYFKGKFLSENWRQLYHFAGQVFSRHSKYPFVTSTTGIEISTC